MSTREDMDGIASDESLIQELHMAASTLSYYNAAEGDWQRERNDRFKAQTRWNTLVEIATQRGVFNKEDFKGYLL